VTRYIDKVIIHCSGIDGKGQTAASIRDYHVNEKGWDDIGYHYVITYYGEIQQGRPLDYWGAHCKGQNKKSIGICVTGNKLFNTGQMKALHLILGLLKQIVPPETTLHGHNQFNEFKTCPNFDLGIFQSQWHGVI
jgi:uncharacterized protein YaiE (UPF0345 family)